LFGMKWNENKLILNVDNEKIGDVWDKKDGLW
jgi:hypothetical protein